jgi:hypothetical protein
MDDAARAALERLQPLVGEWDVTVSIPMVSPSEVSARTTFEWVFGGAFLLQHSEVSHPDAPDGHIIIGANPGGTDYTQHYFDSRGIARLYRMTFDGTLWTLSREEPDFTPLEFSQRFTGRLNEAGDVIEGAWEICHDGETWEPDFTMTYTRL